MDINNSNFVSSQIMRDSSVETSPSKRARETDPVTETAQNLIKDSAQAKENSPLAKRAKHLHPSTSLFSSSPIRDDCLESATATPKEVESLFRRALETQGKSEKLAQLEEMIPLFLTTHPWTLLSASQSAELAYCCSSKIELRGFVEDVVNALFDKRRVDTLKTADLCKLVTALSAAELLDPVRFITIGNLLDDLGISETVDVGLLITAGLSFAAAGLANGSLLEALQKRISLSLIPHLNPDYRLALLNTFAITNDRQHTKFLKNLCAGFTEQQMRQLSIKELGQLVIRLGACGIDAHSFYHSAATVLGEQSHFKQDFDCEELNALLRLYSRQYPMPSHRNLFTAILSTVTDRQSPILRNPSLACDLATSYAAIGWTLEKNIIWFLGQQPGLAFPLLETNTISAMRAITYLSQGDHCNGPIQGIKPMDLMQAWMDERLDGLDLWSQNELLWGLLACMYSGIKFDNPISASFKIALEKGIPELQSTLTYQQMFHTAIVYGHANKIQFDKEILQEVARKLGNRTYLASLDGKTLLQLTLAYADLGHDIGLLAEAQKVWLGPGKLSNLALEPTCLLMVALTGCGAGTTTFLKILQHRLKSLLERSTSQDEKSRALLFLANNGVNLLKP